MWQYNEKIERKGRVYFVRGYDTNAVSYLIIIIQIGLGKFIIITNMMKYNIGYFKNTIKKTVNLSKAEEYSISRLNKQEFPEIRRNLSPQSYHYIFEGG